MSKKVVKSRLKPSLGKFIRVSDFLLYRFDSVFATKKAKVQKAIASVVDLIVWLEYAAAASVNNKA